MTLEISRGILLGKNILLFSIKTSGLYEKPLFGSRGFPQSACSPGVWRLITVLMPFLERQDENEAVSTFISTVAALLCQDSLLPSELIDDLIFLNYFR